MKALEPPDSHALMAAAGWLGLGCPEEALAELRGVAEVNQEHPDVLELQWLIHAERKDWTAALITAGQLVRVAPERPSGWLHRAYAMRRVPAGGLEKAWDLLRPAAGKFPKEPLIPYNLSCYACQLGQLEESRKWLHRALRGAKREAMKRMARQDEDLKPLWNEIDGI